MIDFTGICASFGRSTASSIVPPDTSSKSSMAEEIESRSESDDEILYSLFMASAVSSFSSKSVSLITDEIAAF